MCGYRSICSVTSDIWSVLSDRITATTGQSFLIRQHVPVSGGCISQAWKVSDGQRDYFVKVNDSVSLTLFEAEAAGLAELAASQAVRVPEPVCWGSIGRRAYLVLEYLPLVSGSRRAMARLGQQLAVLHAQPQPYFGWHRDNWIGATPQPNDRCDDWIAFWRDRRLGFQLDLAARNGYTGTIQRHGEKLRSRVAGLFTGYRLRPSLLHGDLWGGNIGCVATGEPVIFDPAVYYGDREADLAMTELFGGFPVEFYAAYREALPLDVGYLQRRTLYNLYHVLNHLNLFGGGYLAQAERMMGQLVGELG